MQKFDFSEKVELLCPKERGVIACDHPSFFCPHVTSPLTGKPEPHNVQIVPVHSFAQRIVDRTQKVRAVLGKGGQDFLLDSRVQFRFPAEVGGVEGVTGLKIFPQMADDCAWGLGFGS